MQPRTACRPAAFEALAKKEGFEGYRSDELENQPRVVCKNLFRYTKNFVSAGVLMNGDCFEGATVMNTVARGAQDNGAAVKTYTLFKMKFMACQSCFNCRREKGDCAINGEVTAALQLVNTADAVVVGSPIYMMPMSGPVKNLYDRFFPLMDSDYKPRHGTKKFATVYSRGMSDPRMFESYFEYTAAMFPCFGFDLVDNIVCVDANDPERAERDAELKIRAYELGKALVG